MQGLLYAAAIILVLCIVVIVHESGHFVLGKLSGIRVDEFAVGFGPKLVARRFGETLYSIRVLPLGGFVRLAGMLGLAGESDAGDRNFYRASLPRRAATVIAGVVFNFVFAGLCFTVVSMAPTPAALASHGPVALAGLHNGDQITAVDGRDIRHDSPDNVAADLHAAALSAQGRPMQITYRAGDGAMRTVTVRPLLAVLNPPSNESGPATADAPPVGRLAITAIAGQPVATGSPGTLLGNGAGVHISGYVLHDDFSPGMTFTDASISGVTEGYGGITGPTAGWYFGYNGGYDGKPFPTAIADGFTFIPKFIQGTFVGIFQLANGTIPGGFTGPNGFSGPVGIAQQTVSATDRGLLGQQGLVWWIGFISMNLGLVNILPIPFLDGGKLMFIGIEAVRRKRLEPRHEAIASAVGLALVLLFVVYVTIGDVSRSLR